MGVNVLLSGLKFVVGVLGSSQAVVADAVHSLTDVTTDLAILLGVQFWSAPPDESHPYGHGRIETMVTSLIGLALTAVAVGLGYNALRALQAPPAGSRPGLIALAGAVVSIVGKELLYRWTLGVGRHVRSSALVANAWHHRSDALSSIPVAIAVVVAWINPEWVAVDHVGALIVSVFILMAAWRIIKPSLLELSDRGATSHTVAEIEKIVMRNDEVGAVHAIRTRHVGAGTFVDLHLLVPEELSVKRGHEIAEAVKSDLLLEGPDIVDVVVHVEPYEEWLHSPAAERTGIWRAGA